MKKYEREFSEISDTLVTAYQNYEIWWFYKNEISKHLQIWNHYLQFFSNSFYSHWVTTIMSIWRLIDDNNLSLITFYDKLYKANLLSNEIKNEIDDKLNGIAYIIKGTKIIRHNVIAHISNKIDADEAIKKANLYPEDIQKIILELGVIFNLIRVSQGKNKLGFMFMMRADEPDKILENDTERLLIDLTKYNNSSA